MKKLFALFVIVIPTLSFAQLQEKETKENPFTGIHTGEYVDANYIDINQTAAMLDLTNPNSRRAIRGKVRGNNEEMSLPRGTVDLNTLTEGMNLTDQSTLNDLFKPAVPESDQK